MDRQLRGHNQLRSFLLDAILKILQKSLILTLYQAQPASRMIIKKREEVDLMLSLDHLSQIITQLLANNGWMVYGGLFLIILAETGLVVTPARRFAAVFIRIDRCDELASIKHLVTTDPGLNCCNLGRYD